MFPVEDVTGLAQCGIDLIERGVVGGPGQRAGNLQGGSRAGLTAGGRDAPEFTEFVLQRLDTAGGVIGHALRRVPFGLGPAELRAEVLRLPYGAFETVFRQLHIDEERVVRAAQRIQPPCECGNLSLRLAEQREEHRGHLEGLLPGLLTHLVGLPDTVEILQRGDRALLCLDELVGRDGRIPVAGDGRGSGLSGAPQRLKLLQPLGGPRPGLVGETYVGDGFDEIPGQGDPGKLLTQLAQIGNRAGSEVLGGQSVTQLGHRHVGGVEPGPQGVNEIVDLLARSPCGRPGPAGPLQSPHVISLRPSCSPDNPVLSRGQHPTRSAGPRAGGWLFRAA
ncbi:hypothetical protein [Streptomyces sp. NPDC053720]|uniref:hypothetical protein n=1 Tax=Streptomyces sp. NPDC053720 TaxID=3154855 RepID=UPI00341B7B28